MGLFGPLRCDLCVRNLWIVSDVCLLSVRWWDTASIRWMRTWAPSIMRLFTPCWTLSAPDTDKRLEMLCYRDWRGSNKTASEGFSIIQNSFARYPFIQVLCRSQLAPFSVFSLWYVLTDLGVDLTSWLACDVLKYFTII